MSDFWCGHWETMKDDEGYAICVRCGASFYDGPLRERDLVDCFDAMARQAGIRTLSELRLEREIEAGE